MTNNEICSLVKPRFSICDILSFRNEINLKGKRICISGNHHPKIFYTYVSISSTIALLLPETSQFISRDEIFPNFIN